MNRVVVIGSGPAGVRAALRSAELGAPTVLVTSGEFGGMAANDGPVPVRVLAHAARLIREARQLGQYGVVVDEPALDYARLLGRVRELVKEVRAQSTRRGDFDALGITLHEHVGVARFRDAYTVETQSGLRLEADSIVLCNGGASRQLPLPGHELTGTHSDAWRLSAVPPSMLVVGSGATGVQVASIFNAFGSRVELFEAGPRILKTEDQEVSVEVAAAFREYGIEVRENFGTITSFEKTATGVRMNFVRDGVAASAEATVAIMALGWMANTSGMNLAEAGVELDPRGFVKVDEQLRTTAPHVYAAGDITGHLMLVPQAIYGGYVAGSNAVHGPVARFNVHVSPIGSFTDPEYAQVGLTETEARATYDIVVTVVRCDSVARTIIDGRKTGLCKLITDTKTQQILGCHVVGEHAVEIVQLAAVAIAAHMPVNELLRIPLSFPTYSGLLVRAAASAARELGLEVI